MHPKALMLVMLLSAGLYSTPALSQQQSSWVLISQTDNVRIYAQEIQCGTNATSFYVFKVENANASATTVRYSIDIASDPTFGTIQGSVQLAGNSSIEGDCTTSLFTDLRLPSDGTAPSSNKISISLTVTP